MICKWFTRKKNLKILNGEFLIDKKKNSRAHDGVPVKPYMSRASITQ